MCYGSCTWWHFCQSEKQNGGWREVTQCFIDICNGKSYFFELFEKKVDWNRHILCIHLTHSSACKNTIPLSIGLLCLEIFPGRNPQLLARLMGVFNFYRMTDSFKFEIRWNISDSLCNVLYLLVVFESYFCTKKWLH